MIIDLKIYGDAYVFAMKLHKLITRMIRNLAKIMS